MSEESQTPPIQAGEEFERRLRFSAEQIVQFANLSQDSNPLHSNEPLARQARFGKIIASGQQSAALMMGLVASHLSRSSDGIRREMLNLNFNFAFKAPVYADQDLLLRWSVTSAEWNSRLNGWLGQLDGTLSAMGAACVIGRCTVLVRHLGPVVPQAEAAPLPQPQAEPHAAG